MSVVTESYDHVALQRGESAWQAPPVRWRPAVADLVDAGFMLALTGVALAGFYPVFGGIAWLWAGLIGAVAGVVLAHIGAATQQFAVVLVGFALGVTVLCSGVLFPDLATAKVLPSAASAREALEGSLRGWHDILSVVPPVGHTGNLLAVPFSGSLAAALIGYSLARRAQRPGAALLAPVALLIAAILIGTPALAPATFELAAQGLAMAVLGLLWGVVQQRRRFTLSGGRLARRPLATALTLVLASAVSVVGLTQLTSWEAPRVVLRDRVVPPFDPSQYGSPLAGFRTFTNIRTQDHTLFTVSGMPPGEGTLRLATMDSYDGLVWNVAGAATQGRSASGWFERIGAGRLPGADASTHTTTVTIRTGELGGVWVPAAAGLDGARIAGPGGSAPAPGSASASGSSQAGGSGLFANDVTGTLARPAGLPAGTTIAEDVALRPPIRLDTVPRSVQPDSGAELAPLALTEPSLLDPITQTAAEWTKPASPAHDTVIAIRDHLLRYGFLSNGVRGGDVDTESGHGLPRLTSMVAPGSSMAGNEEQYSALMALMLRTQRIPARVVVGFTVPGGTSGAVPITGHQAHAWVEVPFPRYGWVRVDATPTRRLSTTRPQTRPQQIPEQNLVPPPIARIDPLAARPDDAGSGNNTTRPHSIWPALIRWGVIAAGGIVLLTGPLWVLMAVKGWRRRRRRNRGRPDQQISAGWRELLDLGRDLGARPALSGTRNEQAAALPIPGAAGLAAAADAAVFAATRPDAGLADLYWEQLRAERRACLSGLSRRGRWRVRLSTASIRHREYRSS